MIELFPATSLDNTILTSVLVGLLVVWVLQETLGWNFTGLVVPGYLASILVLEPATGLVIAVEAVLTCLVVRALSDHVPAWWPWSPLFGRDRFFGLLLASVGVRIVLEGGGFAWMADQGLPLDRELHSMGLVVVPLAANALWRTGIGAGITRLGVPVLITWALLELVLLRFTNLSIASFELTYEDLALDFVSSPRAYILLLCGAFMGSVVNLRFGWDFGGIIVPGLLALVWLEPSRVAATVAEVVLIAVLLKQVVRLPFLRTANLTGGRPLVLAFVLAYLVKFVLGWTLGELWPGLRIRDLFGFGYLLPAMVALRAVRADDLFRPIVPALVTSVAGFAVGTALGLGLAWVMPERPAHPDEPAPLLVGARAPALVMAAWRNEGAPPADLQALLAAREEVLVAGGGGFGGLWIRPRGRPVAVVTRIGPLGLGESALAVADALDARAVLVCAPTGEVCERTVASLGRQMDVLWVEAGGLSVLRGSGRLSSSIHLGSLGAVVGPYQVQGAREAPVLVLSRDARMRAAASVVRSDPAPLDAEAWARPLKRHLLAGYDGPRLRLLAEGVVAPALVWARGEEAADDALRLATGNAESLGLGLLVDEEVALLAGADFQVALRRQGSPLVVHVPYGGEDQGTVPVARALWQALDATALVVDEPPALATRLYAVERPAHVALLGVLAGSEEPLEVLTVRRMVGAADPGAEWVLSSGRPVDGEGLPADHALGDLLQRAGASVVAYDGSSARRALADPGNPAREAAALASGEEAHLTLFATQGALAAYEPLDEVHRLRFAWQAARWPQGALPEGPALSPPAEWAPLRLAIDALVDDDHPQRIHALEQEARAAGARVSWGCDPVVGCRWLVLHREDDGCALVAPVSPRLPGGEPGRAARFMGLGDQVHCPAGQP